MHAMSEEINDGMHWRMAQTSTYRSLTLIDSWKSMHEQEIIVYPAVSILSTSCSLEH